MTCPDDFRRIVGESSCYKVMSPTLNDVSESRDYFQATLACQSYGAHLVSIESVDEQRHLAKVLISAPGQQTVMSLATAEFFILVVAYISAVVVTCDDSTCVCV